MVIIFPLREKIHRLFLQQRPKYTGGRRVVTLPVLPWNNMDRPPVIGYGKVNLPPTVSLILPINYGQCATGVQPILLNSIKQVKQVKQVKPQVVHPLKPLPATVYKLTGVSKDNTGAALGSCIMSLFRVDYDSGNNLIYTFMGSTVSDASGNYSFMVNTNSRYRVLADNSGNTLAGSSLNTLTGTNG
jgi:hypothetical protein